MNASASSPFHSRDKMKHSIFLTQPGYNTQASFAAMVAIGRPHSYSFDALKNAPAGLVPIGTVEYCREYARLTGVTIPEVDTYPAPLRKFLGRDVRRTTFSQVGLDEFVKPVKCKAFTGAIKAQVDEEVPRDEPVYACEPVKFVAEFRTYIHGCEGTHCQYGEGDDVDDGVWRALGDLARDIDGEWHLSGERVPVGYAMDVGLTEDGRLLLIEINDGWALGLYRGMSAQDYLGLIAARWHEIEGKQNESR
jgi:hypothetical protein